MTDKMTLREYGKYCAFLAAINGTVKLTGMGVQAGAGNSPFIYNSEDVARLGLINAPDYLLSDMVDICHHPDEDIRFDKAYDFGMGFWEQARALFCLLA